ncbi:hypothetical protein SUGI_0806440 [Cryptomeria japonica]|uniref:increased DNA methylation 2 n=1 Tax=Cryptomeria japonica TaxID=3369 RepID=UPI002414B960|nr:increased DNA methylation 2 [Cryptomeria japonica]XP_057830780.1 increased DNA methylation 2 [Cryptomeria japonica]XP_057830781.1 increased DNA methylation 2 [Cryptomeria japonica]XP_057830782.1 increased DNA methylation 2 [Cryptomeria japonica]XP_057830783.1 increased DNA methylation 2 [Cryptomeria japonica]GLJ39474.1 hypothetical protein SUGI_0806440 [Cryptomeria japonica]
MDPGSGSQDLCVDEPITLPKSRVGASNDQRFLLIFIAGTYFGPDVKAEVPTKSALQRIALELPPYTHDQLGGSVVRLAEIESVYFYVLRRAHPNVGVKLQSLYKFLQGHLAPPTKENLDDERQFTTLFPPDLHRQARFKGTYKVVENFVFINDPDITYIKAEDIERFKQLTGLTELRLDRDEARFYRHGRRMDRDELKQARLIAIQETHQQAQNGGVPPLISDVSQEPQKRRRKEPVQTVPMPPQAMPGKEKSTQSKSIGPAMILLPSSPTEEQWSNILKATKPSIAFTGSAAARQVGPVIGLVDIGVCEDAYLFRIALPGVKKDQREFSCEVECDGKVVIRGTTTTGEQKVLKNSRTFQMQTQHLCPPGPFTVSFQLPGPVEPREFSGNFGADGVLEGIVMKERERTVSACLTFES